MALSTNLEFFLDSFGQNFPEEHQGVLDCVSIALTCAFNRQGTLLAVGCNDGRICIWDFTTRSIAKIITGHVHPVSSLSWSKNGQRVASASSDGKVCIWATLTGEPVWQFNFSAPILKVQCHPRNMDQYIIVPMKQLAMLITVGSAPATFPRLPSEDDSEDSHTYAMYSRKGDMIFTGNAKGRIVAVDSTTLAVLASFHIHTSAQTPTAVRTIEVSRGRETLVVNAADRIIRIYRISDILQGGENCDIEPAQKLQDLVNKNTWKTVFFSGDGEFVCAGTSRVHTLNIWEWSTGTLVKILHGTKGETLMDAAWHPIRPIIVSVSGGVVSIWSQTHVENWSAFTPDFRELDENIEYEERESEFDVEDEDKSIVQDEHEQDVNDDIDVVSMEKNTAYFSSDEEDEDSTSPPVLFIPITPEIEEPEVDTWLTDTLPGASVLDDGYKKRGADGKRQKTRKDSTATGKRAKLDSQNDGNRRSPRT